jgi:4-amino-4-deoxy-L-arabinose transferase-like glycosyltransferase
LSRSRFEIAALIFLLIAYFVLAGAYAVRTPAWQAPDEPAHYNNVAQVAVNGCCPIIEAGDWDMAYIGQLTSSHFAPDELANLSRLQYEDHQPPLYYLASSLVYSLSGGGLTALRLFSVLIGAGVVLAAYGTARVLAGADRWFLAWGAAAFVAFIPQHLAMLAAVNNDGTAELVVGIALYLALRYLRGDKIPVWLLGVIVGVGFLTKVSTLLLAGIIPLAILLRWWGEKRAGGLPGLLRPLIIFAVPALILGGVWWARNINVYGFADIFGLRRHDQVVADQPRTRDIIAQSGFGQYLSSAAQTTFNSFWGQFGWMAYPLPGWAYTAIWAFLGAVAVGWVVRMFAPHPPTPSRTQAGGGGEDSRTVNLWVRASALLLAAVALVALAQYVYYNTEFYQVQGRYLFPALIPLGIFIAYGLDGWSRLWVKRYPKWRGLAQAPLLLFIPLNLWILWQVIPLLG